MRLRLLWVAVALALVATSGALAARGDPQKRITPADQARAKSMLLRKSDLVGYKSTPPSSNEDDDYYCKALDASDLTLTGDAESPDFELQTVFLSSAAEVYESEADANASWRRGTSAAGEKCMRDVFRREFAKQGIRMLGFRRSAFPRLAQRSFAFRLTAESQGVRVFFDFIVLQQSRAHATLFMGSALVAAPKSEEIRLARIIEGRMKTAMRG